MGESKIALLKDGLHALLVTALVCGIPMGVAFLGVTVANRIDEARVEPMTATAEATVTDVIHYTTGFGRKRNPAMRQTCHDVYAYVVAFEDGDGVAYETRAINEGEVQEHSVGDSVSVRYDPQDPESCVIA